MNKPVIGITTGGRTEGYVASKHYSEFYSSPAKYIDSVRRAGGLPLLIPVGENDWEQTLELLDGVIITGGTDIDPTEYHGNTAHPNLHPADHERDTADLSLARYLVDEKQTPLLCICRGLQVLNVACGGTLHEHLPDVIDIDIHRSPEGIWATQQVHIDEDSLVAHVMETSEVITTSGHHQAVKTPGKNLKIVGRAPDGIVEALEMPDHPWLIAVQWHPEVTAHDDETQQRIFDALVEQARLRKEQKQALKTV